ncbi:hypothetical protein NC651_001345 [Populus alba x Populus x berolinensis]|nr:hypothetical protein NC651_001345 [Populus alba x Populus x berolinensis]
MNGVGPRKLTMGPLPGVQNVRGDHWKRNKVSSESEYGKLILCELSTQAIRDLDFRRFSSCEGIYVYKESCFVQG